VSSRNGGRTRTGKHGKALELSQLSGEPPHAISILCYQVPTRHGGCETSPVVGRKYTTLGLTKERGEEESIVRASPTFRLAAAFLMAFIARGVASADDSCSSAVQISADGSLVVVADTAHNSLTFYRVNGNAIATLGRRDLYPVPEADKRPTTSAPAPTKDVPGDDPPSFPRPKQSVRILATYSQDGARQEWTGYYLVPGTVDDIYSGIRNALKDWKVATAGVNSDTPSPRGDLNISKGTTELQIGVFKNPFLPEGWVKIQVSELQKRG
jgi:hypothetical protein